MTYSASFPWEALSVAGLMFLLAFLVRRMTWARWVLVTFGVIVLMGSALLWANPT